MPVPLPGYYNFATQDQQNDYTVNHLANLGAQIGQTISQQNMRDEAQQLAPLISQKYQQGFQQIGNGDIAGGLGLISQTGAATASNPLLAPLAKGAEQQGHYLAQNLTRQDIAATQAGSRNWIATQREQGLNNRNDARIQAKQNAPITPSQVLTGINALQTASANTTKILQDNASTEDEKVGALQNIMHIQQTMNQAGFDANNPYITAQMKSQIQKWNDKIAAGPQGSGWLGMGTKVTPADIKDFQSYVDGVTNAAKKAAQEGRVPSIQGQQIQGKSAPQAISSGGSNSQFSNPNDVGTALQNGSINRQQARQILQSQFGYQ